MICSSSVVISIIALGVTSCEAGLSHALTQADVFEEVLFEISNLFF